MTKLGPVGCRKTASLFGLDPFDRDSGQHRCGRHIFGGRSQPRHLLYMAAMAAVPWAPSSEACYERLLALSKPHKVAVMCRLAGLLDTLLHGDRLWQAERPAWTLGAAA